ncbi:MAG: hypothetical protein WCI39_12320 [Gallionellaceae bacterium]
MNEIMFVVEEAPEGGWTARALGESIFTEADDLEEIHQQVHDAVHCHFEEGKAPKMIRLHFNTYLSHSLKTCGQGPI